MSSENLRMITQQPMDDPADPNRYYPFPAIDGLVKPPRPAITPVRRVGLHLADGQEHSQPTEAVTLSASPFHGVTRLAIMVDGFVSQNFNNGKGDVDGSGQLLPHGKRGRYFDEVDSILAIDFTVDLPRICWKVRHPDGFRTVQFDLFAPERSVPIWSLLWDEAQIAANIHQGALTAGFKEEDGEFAPIVWTGSMDWEQTVRITDPAFPGGRLTTEMLPYQLRMTVNGNNPGPTRMGYPLVAWTYFYVVERAGDTIAQPTGWLAVQLCHEGMALADLPVQFYTLTPDNRPDRPIGELQRTNAEGIVLFVEPVDWTNYGCAIENQPLVIISPVKETVTPLVLMLPIGEPHVETFALLGDELDEAEELVDEEALLDSEEWEEFEGDEDAVATQSLDEAKIGWLVVQLRYEGMPLADLPVQFYTLTPDNRPDQPIGELQRTNAEGIVLLAEPVDWTNYGCAIENQPLVAISPVANPSTPLVLMLPIGEPHVETFAAIADQPDEAAELGIAERTPA